MQQSQESSSPNSLMDQQVDEQNGNQVLKELYIEDDGIIEYIDNELQHQQRQFNILKLQTSSNSQHNQDVNALSSQQQTENKDSKQNQQNDKTNKFQHIFLENLDDNAYLCSQIVIDLDNNDEGQNISANLNMLEQQPFFTIQHTVHDLQPEHQESLSAVSPIKTNQYNQQIKQQEIQISGQLQVKDFELNQQRVLTVNNNQNQTKTPPQTNNQIIQPQNNNSKGIDKTEQINQLQNQIDQYTKDNQQSSKLTQNQKVQQVQQNQQPQQVLPKQVDKLDPHQKTPQPLQSNPKQQNPIVLVKFFIFIILLIAAMKALTIFENIQNNIFYIIKHHTKKVTVTLVVIGLFVIFVLLGKSANNKNNCKRKNHMLEVNTHQL